MWAPNRRTLLATSSLTLVGLSTGWTHPAIAIPPRTRQPISTFGPDFIAPDILRALAQGGVDAARSAGASYADIRISDLRRFEMLQGEIPLPGSDLFFEFGYGIRVQVGGAWAFAYGGELNATSIARSARSAVETARGLAKLGAGQRELVPAPVVTGEWATPFEIDPFSVPPDEHAYIIGSYYDAATRVPDSDVVPCKFSWDRETRVFASSEGSLVTQRLTRIDPQVRIELRLDPYGAIRLPVPGIVPRSAGFEFVLGTENQERIKAAAEEAARLAQIPVGVASLARVPAVIDGNAMGSLFVATMAQALVLGRSLGYEANGEGTSFLAPINKILGAPLFSPLLNVTADRAMPHYGAIKWDDEGVATETYPIIRQGGVVDYFATRSTAPALADWYTKQNMPLRSRGAAIAWRSRLLPSAYASNLTMTPGTGTSSLDTMVKDLSNGILLQGSELDSVHSDPQLSGGLFFPSMMFEVKQGKIVRRLLQGHVQFSTQKFWKSITALGDASTVEHYARPAQMGTSGIEILQPISAPAAHVSDIDVVPPRRV